MASSGITVRWWYRLDMGQHRVLVASALLAACTDGTPPPAGVTEIDVGPITSDTPFKIQIPEHALGFHIVVEVDDSTGTEPIGISSLVSPSNMVVVEDFFATGNHVPFATDFGLAALSVPQTSATASAPIEAGEWTATASIDANRPAHARVYVRTTEDGEFHGGQLDLRLYIPDGLIVGEPSAHAVTAETAAGDPAIMERVDSFYTTLRDLFELDRGNVELVPLPAEYAQITDLAKRKAAMTMTSAPGSSPAVHVILVNTLQFENGNSAWGLTTWNPGTATTAGHPMAGVFVNISLSKSPVADGMTTVHELGHFAGLYHTTEGNRAYWDPLDDTPECQPGTTTCPDGHNIMFATFWGASRGVDLTASDQQRRVMWGSPLYRQP
jgi:hypothetical protein